MDWNYDIEIFNRSSELCKWFLNKGISISDLSHDATIPKNFIRSFLDRARSEEAFAWSIIEKQLCQISAERVGTTSILVPVYKEPFRNLECLIHSLKDYKGELILLFNSSSSCCEDIVKENEFTQISIGRYIRAQKKINLKVIVIDANRSVQAPSVGTARLILLWIESYRCLHDSKYLNTDSVMGRKLLMTDADCVLSDEFMSWSDCLYSHNTSILAYTANIKFYYSGDPIQCEGIKDGEHLARLMIGELYRNILAVSTNSVEDREERPWIGMGMGFTLQAAIVAGGFPRGWRRKEDHYLGAMLETIQLHLGSDSSIYHSSPEDPFISSVIRASDRTEAGIGHIDDQAESGVEKLTRILSTAPHADIVSKALNIDPFKRDQIMKMPTTILLVEILFSKEYKNSVKKDIFKLLKAVESYLSCRCVSNRQGCWL